MRVESEVFTALLNRLGALSNAPVIAWPGMAFSEPTNPDTIWLEARLFPTEPQRVSFAGEAADYRGYMQVTVCQRRGRGIIPVTDQAGALAAHFPEALRLFTASGIGVSIYRPPGIGGVFETDGQVRLPVAIYYQAIA